MRLDKYVSSVTDYSRAEVKRLLQNGSITVNGSATKNSAQQLDTQKDIICLFDDPLRAPAPRYFMLNKPVDTICATEDSMHPTVIDLLNEPNSHQLHVAGRLDKDTTGLVLLTDDGQWSHQITSPNKHCSKTYRAELAEIFTDSAKQALEEGVLLHNEKKPTRPATVNIINERCIELSIVEGKYHQVKRMLAAVGNHVNQLHRQQIGSIALDPSLDVGEYRLLTPEEVSTVSA
ncbi:MAG: 16S rRNA pseudouridine516 synthase [Granulosicoccus sp.]|jgi:16S rRNA pseudouridine516 synthase